MKTCLIHEIPYTSQRRLRKGGFSYIETRCIKCRNEKSIQWYHENKNTVEYKKTKRNYEKANKRSLKNLQLMSKYGITIEQYEDMLAKQQDCCAICETHKSKFKKELSVDHCHKTGKVRGLLCSPCNQAIGLFKDSPKRLVKAGSYLAESN